MSTEENTYGLSSAKKSTSITLPTIDYLPHKPKSYNPTIGLIGTGGISQYHLKNYQEYGYRVVALANRTLAKAESMRDQFYPEASVYSDYKKLLRREDIEVIDVTPHPNDRLPILYDCLNAGKHVLSQKPFVLDLEEGKKLADLADKKARKIAVNQNGRWSPHFSYLRNAVTRGLIGEVTSIDYSLQWDHTWIKGNPSFEKMVDLILFDFGIHWFDITACIMAGKNPDKIYASTVSHSSQVYEPPALASVIIDYPETQVRMSFNGHCTRGEQDTTTLVGTKGTLRSRGPGLNEQSNIEIFLQEGSKTFPLSGSWFTTGFAGTMSELLCAIEEDREPTNSARNNLKTLELCFAARKSASQRSVINFSSLD
ncbi:MAG: Gfo/Idh/MocA family oxidoreductase [Opitutales bacterium]|nr:Gfo/Idh/MocA family oxidoreductase [Opitutales bacterium]